MRLSNMMTAGSLAMRKMILSALLATCVALPAMAQDRDFRQRDRSEQRAGEPRDEAREARRAERAAARERGEQSQQAVQRPDAGERAVRRGGLEHRDGDRRHWGERRSNRDGLAAAIERQRDAERAREQRQVVVQEQHREDRRDTRRDGRRRDGSWVGSDRHRHGQSVTYRDRDWRDGSRHSRSDRRWNNHWRSDRHYDWRRHRDRNRSLFRIGNYWDPYGSRYRRFSIGFSLSPSYYRPDFWLDDPWMYRLPPAYGPYRWVRYYDDALLVNIYTGQVVDVVHNFFW